MDTGLGTLTFTLKYLSFNGAYWLDRRRVCRYTTLIRPEKKAAAMKQPQLEVIQRHQPMILDPAWSLVIIV